jgi:hypothetical protein
MSTERSALFQQAEATRRETGFVQQYMFPFISVIE